MLIATFNASTGWAGKTVHHENDQFVLEGHGPISAADVLAYDEQGYLDWANDGTRAWVQATVGPPQTRATTFSEAPVGPRLTSVWTKVKASAGAASVVAASAAQTAKVAYEGAIEAVKEQRGSASGPAGEETASPAREACRAAVPPGSEASRRRLRRARGPRPGFRRVHRPGGRRVPRQARAGGSRAPPRARRWRSA